jgi:hypothetical protein
MKLGIEFLFKLNLELFKDDRLDGAREIREAPKFKWVMKIFLSIRVMGIQFVPCGKGTSLEPFLKFSFEFFGLPPPGPVGFSGLPSLEGMMKTQARAFPVACSLSTVRVNNSIASRCQWLSISTKLHSMTTEHNLLISTR